MFTALHTCSSLDSHRNDSLWACNGFLGLDFWIFLLLTINVSEQAKSEALLVMTDLNWS